MAPAQVDLQATSDSQAATFLDDQCLTVDNVDALRKKIGPLSAGTAAKADVEQLKGHWRHEKKPRASKDWTHGQSFDMIATGTNVLTLPGRFDKDRLSSESSSRHGSAIKEAAQYLKLDGMLNLGGGLPSSDYFPFDQVSFKAPRVDHFSEQETRNNGAILISGKHDMREAKSFFDPATAYNYGQGCGSVQLLRFVVEHTDIVHNPPYRDWQCTLSVGSTSAVDMCFRMFGHPGMYILSEEYTFTTAAECGRAMGMEVAPVGVDHQGILPECLDHVLSTWDPASRYGAPKPFILYTVPTGQNPTGSMQGAQRRKDIYAIAEKHDLLIIEDEPYYFLQMQPYVAAPDGRAQPIPPATLTDFLSLLTPSYLHFDTTGRVLRIDSFSKVIAPGTRVGWVTGPAHLIEAYRRHSDVSTQGPSGFSQLALFKLLDEHWGHAGYLRWLIHIRVEYSRRRDVLVRACEEFLPRDIVSWTPPMAGMFHWLKVEWRRHPRAQEMSMLELEDRIWKKGIERRALLIKGSFFRAEGTGEDMFFRATFAAAPEGELREAVRRFGSAIREEFGLGNGPANGVNGH